MRSDVEFRLNREIEEHRVLFDQLADAADGDEAFLADLIEGETGIFELIDKLDAIVIENEILGAGIAEQLAKMQARKKAAENRVVRMKASIKSALEIVKLSKHRMKDGGQYIVSPKPITAIVLDEMEMPTKWKINGEMQELWRKPEAPPSVIDQALLTSYFRDAKKAADAANKLKDPDAREAALKQVDIDFPPIPGVSVSAPATQISRR